MKCQRCKERDANVQIVQQEMGKKPQTFMLCDVCARELGISIPTFSVPVKLNNPFAVMGNAFQTTFGIGADDIQKRRVTRCDRCNLSFDEFRKTGFLGCPNCYEAFGIQIDPVFCRTQMGKKHLGRHLGEKMKSLSKKKPEGDENPSAEERLEHTEISPDGVNPKNTPTEAKPTHEAAFDNDFRKDFDKEYQDRIMNSIEQSMLSTDYGKQNQMNETESEDLINMERKQQTALIAQKKEELDAAIAREDYLAAAKLRDEIAELKAKGE